MKSKHKFKDFISKQNPLPKPPKPVLKKKTPLIDRPLGEYLSCGYYVGERIFYISEYTGSPVQVEGIVAEAVYNSDPSRIYAYWDRVEVDENPNYTAFERRPTWMPNNRVYRVRLTEIDSFNRI